MVELMPENNRKTRRKLEERSKLRAFVPEDLAALVRNHQVV